MLRPARKSVCYSRHVCKTILIIERCICDPLNLIKEEPLLDPGPSRSNVVQFKTLQRNSKPAEITQPSPSQNTQTPETEIEIILRLSFGKDMKFNIFPSSTISTVKSMLLKANPELETRKIVFLFFGRKIELNQTINDLKVKQNSVIQVFVTDDKM